MSNQYTAWLKTIGKFDIYVQEYDAEDLEDQATIDPNEEIEWQVRLTIKGDDTAVRRQAYGSLVSVAEAFEKKEYEGPSEPDDVVDSFETEVFTKIHEKHKVLGEKITEMTVDFYGRYETLVQVLEAETKLLMIETIVGEHVPDMSNIKISLSCAFKSGKNKYVRVRFSGYSVEFHFNEDGWMKKKTEDEMSLSTSKRRIAMKVLEANTDMILERARDKAVNKSGIGISTPIQLHVLIPSGDGQWKLAGNSKTVNNPEIEPALLVREDMYSSANSYFVNNDKIFKIVAFKRDSGYEWGNGPAKNWVEDLRFSAEDKSLRVLEKHLRPANLDGFTKKRIERAIKRKL